MDAKPMLRSFGISPEVLYSAPATTPTTATTASNTAEAPFLDPAPVPPPSVLADMLVPVETYLLDTQTTLYIASLIPRSTPIPRRLVVHFPDMVSLAPHGGLDVAGGLCLVRNGRVYPTARFAASTLI